MDVTNKNYLQNKPTSTGTPYNHYQPGYGRRARTRQGERQQASGITSLGF